MFLPKTESNFLLIIPIFTVICGNLNKMNLKLLQLSWILTKYLATMEPQTHQKGHSRTPKNNSKKKSPQKRAQRNNMLLIKRFQ